MLSIKCSENRILWFVMIICLALLLIATLILVNRRVDDLLLSTTFLLLRNPIQPHWLARLREIGVQTLVSGILIIIVFIWGHHKNSLSVGKQKAFTIISIAIFILFSVVYHLAAYNGRYPYIFIPGDVAAYASFAAADEHPDLFQADPMLSDPGDRKMFVTVLQYLFPILKDIFGDYGTGSFSLLGIFLLLHCIGFFFLGLILFEDIFYANLFVWASLVTVWIPGIGDFWGIYPQIYSRVMFTSLLPFVLYAACKWRFTTKYWPLLMVFNGLLLYFHPVSGPTWGLAIWLGLIPFLPNDWSGRKKFYFMFLMGLIYLLVIAPYGSLYLTSYSYGETVDYQKVYEIFKFRFMPGFTDLQIPLKGFFLGKDTALLLGLAVISMIYLFTKVKDKQSSLALLLWFIGILIASVIMPVADYAIAAKHYKLPVELDLIRGVRFFVPLSLIAIFLAAKSIWSEDKSKNSNLRYLVVSITLVIFVVAYSGSFRDMRPPLDFVYSYLKGDASWGLSKTEGEDLEALNFIKALPDKTSFLSFSSLDPLSIRWYALKPDLFDMKDGGHFAYANSQKLIGWFEKAQRLSPFLDYSGVGKDNLIRRALSQEEMETLLEIAADWDADYIILSPKVIPEDFVSTGRVVFSNDSHVIIEVSFNAEQNRIE